MTAKRDLKSIIRDRQQKTGESYTAARAHVMRERAKLLGIDDEPNTAVHIDVAVLAVSATTAQVRIVGETQQRTLRTRSAFRLAPGLVATILVDKRGEKYVTGKIAATRIDIPALGLPELRVEGGEAENLREIYEHVRAPDRYAPLWRKLTAKPRRCFEMDGIAWGAFPDADPDDNPTIEAAELRAAGDLEGAYDLLMETLLRDLRCLDAHAHLGNLVFDREPARAIVHYEIGMRIGDHALGESFDGVLAWSALFNRPFLRCLHGYGLCLWRLGRTDEAVRVFERMLALNPNDNQGARFCLFDVRDGVTWEAAQARDEAEDARLAAAAVPIRAARARRQRDDHRVN